LKESGAITITGVAEEVADEVANEAEEAMDASEAGAVLGLEGGVCILE
jgi:hypothetical protein